MATLTLQIADDAHQDLLQRAAKAGFPDAGGYVGMLVHQHAVPEEEMTDELVEALLKGMNSGEAVEVNEVFWARVDAKAHAMAGLTPP